MAKTQLKCSSVQQRKMQCESTYCCNRRSHTHSFKFLSRTTNTFRVSIANKKYNIFKNAGDLFPPQWAFSTTSCLGQSWSIMQWNNFVLFINQRHAFGFRLKKLSWCKTPNFLSGLGHGHQLIAYQFTEPEHAFSLKEENLSKTLKVDEEFVELTKVPTIDVFVKHVNIARGSTTEERYRSHMWQNFETNLRKIHSGVRVSLNRGQIHVVNKLSFLIRSLLVNINYM